MTLGDLQYLIKFGFLVLCLHPSTAIYTNIQRPVYVYIAIICIHSITVYNEENCLYSYSIRLIELVVVG